METGEIIGYADFGTDDIIEDIRSEREWWDSADAQANARRVMRLYGWNLPDGENVVAILKREATKVVGTVDWHYHGESGWSYGQDSDGHNYEQSPDGTVKRIYSLNERRRVVELAQRLGPGIASRKYGVPRETIRSWSRRAA
jgi:hypothetical protein